ncbi:MAG: hypothetical protein WCV67_02345 [Victivallaceae bacterium]|jgi:hypothetical protein
MSVKITKYAFLLLCAGILCLAGCRSEIKEDKPIAPPAVKQPEKEFSGKHEAAASGSALETLAKVTSGMPGGPASGANVKYLNVNNLIVPETEAGRFLSSECFVTRWNILGPFIYDPENYKKTDFAEIVHELFMQEEKSLTGVERTANPNIGWQLARFESSKYPGEIDLRKLFKNQVRHGAVYAVTYLKCTEPMSSLILYAGSSGFLKIWINHKLVHTYNQAVREGKWDQDAINGVKLQQGFNQIVVKSVSTGGEDWNFYFRLASENDLPLKFRPE